MRKHILGILALCLATAMAAQTKEGWTDEDIVMPRIRVIVDNDFGGDPDGLFHLAQQLLSSSAEVKAIVCSHHYRDFYGYAGDVATAKKQVDALLDVMQLKEVPVCLGSDLTMTETTKPLESEGARMIVTEAMRDDKRPLYILCGAGLTNIASAYLMEPEIAGHIRAVVWIGGVEYPELCRNWLQKQREYNQGIDKVAAQVVFNHSTLHLWQFPRDVYRQALYSHAELSLRIGQSSPVGKYLMSRLDDLLRRAKGQLGEAYVLGDSPLALATALQSAWESDAASCEYVTRRMPRINDQGFYEENPDGRPIRVFTRIDSRLMLEDLVAKLNLTK